MSSLTFNGCRTNSDRTGLTEFCAVIRILNTFPPSMAVMEISVHNFLFTKSEGEVKNLFGVSGWFRS